MDSHGAYFPPIFFNCPHKNDDLSSVLRPHEHFQGTHLGRCMGHKDVLPNDLGMAICV